MHDLLRLQALGETFVLRSREALEAYGGQAHLVPGLIELGEDLLQLRGRPQELVGAGAEVEGRGLETLVQDRAEEGPRSRHDARVLNHVPMTRATWAGRLVAP